MTVAVRHRERTALMGMAVFVASWAMLFAALFFAYGLSRLRAVTWPPADLPPLPLGLPALATLVLAASSGALQRALVRLRAGQPAQRSVLLAASLGVAFLLLQAVVWQRMSVAGLHPRAGAYASFFFALTVFHALHVVVGLVALAWLTVRPRALSLRLWSIYWHMVGVIWGVMFLLVYVI
jgi:heme/copper-type cytochrome/quinol oxidase subunit 3